jgi:disintegrin and metalloproteinase domain-containing protein 10
MLWDYMTRSTISSSIGDRPGLGYDPSRAREEITSLFANHVDGIKKIYQNTIFLWDNLGPFRSFTFAVHRIQINTSADCANGASENPFCKANIDVSNFLNLNSLTNQDLYCLAYVFTYRDFTQGTLGLAWVGSSLRASGGLCERWKEYSENNKRIFKSLNTGIVTLVNYGSRVPPKVSTLTFAHEVGHNFGSPHDSGDICVPSQNNQNNPNGNFIMFASATSGDKPNNHNFSSCSIGNMTQVLNAVLTEQYGKENCFRESEEAFCGNRIAEPTEECDCGFKSDCDNNEHPDICCYPQEHATLACQRKDHANCSVSEGPCCVSDTCQFESSFSHKLCLIAKDCSHASYCDGKSAKCPTPAAKENLSLCNVNTQVCRNGECTGSVCEKIDWKLCFIDAPTNDKTYDRGLLCFVSCQNPISNQCVSSGSQKDLSKSENIEFMNLLVQLNLTSTGIRMPAGMPCDNYRGYCDVFQKCRAVNEDGPLARLKNLLFSDKTISELKDLITTYWWAALLISLLLVILMGLFIKVCAVHTPSSNPKQTPARKLTLPRRHAHRPQGPPPPYSAEPSFLGGYIGPSTNVPPPHSGVPRQNRSRQAREGHTDVSGRHISPAASSSAARHKKRSNIEMNYRPNQI